MAQTVLTLVLAALLAFAISYPLFLGAQAGQDKVVIGVLFDFLRERWPRDRDAIVKAASGQNAEVLVKSAESNDELQIAQARELISQSAKVLLVVPHNLKKAGEIVKLAHQKSVKVIAYDRLIRDCDLDFYASFDNFKVGELQAQYALGKKPAGNYVLLGGSPADFNAVTIHGAWIKVLDPAVKSGKVRIAVDLYSADWKPEIARANMESALKTLNNDVAAVLAGNDNLARAAIQALEAKGLAGKVLVVGQDAELDAMQRIVAGTQAMTVYKPIPKLGRAAVELAARISRGQKVNHLVTNSVNNGFKEVPAILLRPVVVDKTNMDQTVIADGVYTREQVYRK